MATPDIKINAHDALIFLRKYLRGEATTKHHSSGFDYDLYVKDVAQGWYEDMTGKPFNSSHGNPGYDEMLPILMDASWDYCRRGILRPGTKTPNGQSTPAGSAGAGYTITTFGKAWLAEEENDIFVPTEPERFAQFMSKYDVRFGEGFRQRSQEAIRCYGAHAYFGCCAMCGAASESVLLAVAIAKSGDPNKTVNAYQRSRGRSNILNIVKDDLNSHLKSEIDACTALLDFWRDESAHGMAKLVDDNKAWIALASLIRFAQFSDDRWDELTRRS